MTDAGYITEIEGLRATMERLAIVLCSANSTDREYTLAEAAYVKVFDSFCAVILTKGY